MSNYTVHGVSISENEVVSVNEYNDRHDASRAAVRLVRGEDGDPEVECSIAYVYDNMANEVYFIATAEQQEYLG